MFALGCEKASVSVRGSCAPIGTTLFRFIGEIEARSDSMKSKNLRHPDLEENLIGAIRVFSPEEVSHQNQGQRPWFCAKGEMSPEKAGQFRAGLDLALSKPFQHRSEAW